MSSYVILLYFPWDVKYNYIPLSKEYSYFSGSVKVSKFSENDVNIIKIPDLVILNPIYPVNNLAIFDLGPVCCARSNL